MNRFRTAGLGLVALGILAGAEMGAGLDDMPVGIGLGAAAGFLLEAVLGRGKREPDR